MSDTIAAALELARVAGALSCAGGRARTDCPYDQLYFPNFYEAWVFGWDMTCLLMKTEPVGG